ncbi:phage tail tape measure protein [Pseudahrensia aquimaris]|uniref:Phage tail tape measure protein n=1 Tax=Pseudahrensia aquimaris TaxID=744461 RepID=A0ABW3FE75_9HYPH
MSRTEEPIIIPLEADFSGFQSAMGELENSSKRFASAFSSSFRTAIRTGQSFDDTLKSLALRLSDIALQTGVKPLENAVSGLLQTAVSSLTNSVVGGGGAGGFDVGGAIASVFGATQTANVARTALPTFAGPTSVKSVQPTSSPAPNVTFNISTPDVQGFQKSQTQISTLLARTVSRSRRGA